VTKSLRLIERRATNLEKLTQLPKKSSVGVNISHLLFKWGESMCFRGYGALRFVWAGKLMHVTGSGMEWIA